MIQERIASTVDVHTMGIRHATIVGGGYGLANSLVRCGLGSISLVDYATVQPKHPARQDLYVTDVGLNKVQATAADLLRINPNVNIETHVTDFCALSEEQMDALLGHTDLLVMATDFFPAQARGNIEALRLHKPTLWIGMYRGGRAGEIVVYVPEVTPACYRCICSARYAAFAQGGASITSDGGTILDLRLVDAVAGQFALGALTHGADNRMGTLIGKLGNRNFLQVKIDPDYTLGDRDIFAEHLGDGPANFSFSTIALPMDRDPDCPDCGHLCNTDGVEPCLESCDAT